MDFSLNNIGNVASDTTMTTMGFVSNVTVIETINTTLDFIVNVGLNRTVNASNNSLSISNTFSNHVTTMSPVFMYINLTLFVFGCLGNSLTILVSIKTKPALKPTMIYFKALAVSDIIILVFNALSPALLELFDYGLDRALSSPYICKLSTWILYSCVEVSSCVLVVVTIERFICVTIPHKVKLYCYQKVAKATVASIFVSIYGVNCHFLFGMHVNEVGLCTHLTGPYSFFINEIFPVFYLFVAFVVPFITIFVGNSVIIYKLYQRKQQRLGIANSCQEGQRNDSSVTVMLIVVNVWFIICMAPFTLYNVLSESNNENEDQLDPTFAFWNAVLNTMTNLNAVGNFYLYFISGKSFRKQANTLLCGFRCGRNVQNAFVP